MDASRGCGEKCAREAARMFLGGRVKRRRTGANTHPLRAFASAITENGLRRTLIYYRFTFSTRQRRKRRLGSFSGRRVEECRINRDGQQQLAAAAA